MMIRNAIRLIRAVANSRRLRSTRNPGSGDALIQDAEIFGIVDLPGFQRFAFVLSVLEGYSDREARCFSIAPGT